MKKILVLFTGGTIGSITTDGIIDVEREGKYAVVEAYKSAYGDDVEFECRQVLNILSENMGFSGWEKMIHEINGIDSSQNSGVILTHGSDTLAYTSALLGMYFRHFDIPLFIIASNKPIGEKGSNGLFNFTSAVGLIKEEKYKGVFTLYERVMLPTRVIPADTCRDRFGVYGYDGFNDFSVFSGVSENMLSRPRERIFHNDIKFGKRVLFIEGYPAMDFGCFVPSDDTAAVLYSPYHSATACTDVSEGENYALTEFIKRCITKNIMVYICGLKRKVPIYSTVAEIIKAGSIPIYSTSAVAAYMKLLLAYNQEEMPVKEVMGKDLFFEEVKFS
ncbi:asparaginase domain-containing protein [Ruminococcus sp.]